MALLKTERLSKQLSLLDVYLISTGAMFSSGFFLLPGIAASAAGPSVVLAYFISGLLIVPALLSQAELATAMPRAGGAYYYLDRTLGPLVGTMGGFGAWFALILKSAFALIGIGTYLALFFDVPFTPIAVTFAVIFGILNIFGARESTGLLRWLVFGLLTLLAFFVIDGLANASSLGFTETYRTRFTPFLLHGVDGLLGTVGLVFVSYVGLTQVVTLAEEVKDPERNIPLGMTISLITVATMYVVGVAIMVAVLGIDELSRSLTPVAHAAQQMFHWLPPRVGEFLLVAAAVAAFASMSNTGILAASRYPLAMARDHLIPGKLATLGRFRTPVFSIILTCSILILFLVLLDVRGVAELASAIQLTLFGLLNIAVIVMRESRIESYDPGFRSPLYPWVQVVGIVAPLVLVAEMGWLPALFTMGVFAASIGWYNYYARGRLARDGAIYHVFERLGRRRFAGLDRELRDIMKEKGARAADPFDEIVARAFVIDLETASALTDVVNDASDLLQRRVPADAVQIREGFIRAVESGLAPVSHGALLLHMRLPDMASSELVLVRCGIDLDVGAADTELSRQAAEYPIRAVFFLVSGEGDAGQHLRILAQLAGRIEDDGFMSEWVNDYDEQELKETLLRDDRFLSLRLRTGTRSESLIGKSLREIHLPEGNLIALIRRYGETLVPRGGTILRGDDRLTIIGTPAGLREVELRYGGAHDTREYPISQNNQT
ncbi:MAG: amino acid permease [Gemmatimonadota bacterium]|nr:MAG: amino acid permease [Gemmatimonadota bacterium]